MDIQRGDQVYYRGEVWTVWDRVERAEGKPLWSLERRVADGGTELTVALSEEVQRVEQVR